MKENLSLYYIFHTVAENGNISYAAKKLYISQPAISKAIHKLEANLNTKLFERSSRGVTLTESGFVLYEATKMAFSCILEAEDKIIRIKEMEIGQIRLGASTTLCKYILLPKLERFMEHYPNIKVTISCQSTLHTIKLLEEKKVDIGLVGSFPKKKDVRFYPISWIQDIFVVSPGYLERIGLKKDKFNEEFFDKANIMLLEAENISRKYMEEYFKKHRITVNHILEVGTMDLLIEFAKMGLGAACVIKEFVEQELKNGTLIEIPLMNKVEKREIGFIYYEPSIMSEATKRFLKSICKEDVNEA